MELDKHIRRLSDQEVAVSIRLRPVIRTGILRMVLLVFAFLMIPTGPSHAQCTLGLTNYWMLDESSGSTFVDSVGGVNATCSAPNCPQFSTGIIGNALMFDGINGSINVSPHASFNWGNSDSFSIEFWVQTDPVSSCTGSQGIVGRDDGPTNLQWWVGCKTGGQPVFNLGDNTGNKTELIGTKDLTNGFPYSIWGTDAAVGPESQPENGVQVELGVKFRADVDGYITGIRFYKYPLNTGTHTGNLWTMSGTNLGRVTFSGETASGWQEARFAAPIAITANTTYIISYYTPSGHFARSAGFFSSTGVDKPPLHFLSSGVDGVNGVYRLSTMTVFPDQPSSDNYYWVDAVFEPRESVWHHIAAVRDADAHEIRLYTDGVKEASQVTTYQGGFDSAAAPLNIGTMGGMYHFQGVIDEVALYNRALSDGEIRSHYYLARGYCDLCANPVQIMPLGDSITLGYGTGGNATLLETGYRQPLYLSLSGSGYNTNFVGSLKAGQSATPSFDFDHEGHAGYTSGQVAGQAYTWLVNNPADVVLLHIGTNDLDMQNPSTDPSNVESILNEIDQYDQRITVMLARIIDTVPYSSATTQFNNNVQAMAQGRIANGDKIIMVDDESALDYSADMADNLHPNQTGYNKMATIWMNSLGTFLPANFLPVCGGNPAPVITSIPVTAALVGQPYTYDVNATGSPVPSYQLVNPPLGMTIDQGTGLIQWTPTASGAYPVTVEASNGVGTPVAQSFTINVVNAVPSISLSPTSLSASTAQGGNASSQSFQVRNSGGGTLSYTISKNATWLSCTPASGTSTGEQDTIAVNYATSVLSAGTYTATITITASGATNSPQTIPVSLTVNAVPGIEYSIWSPGVAVGPESQPENGVQVELGVKFRADADGYITGIRFYKYPLNTGTHTGNLWTMSGTNLGRVTFSGETASGWQEARFAAPIAITANTTYIISYYTPSGHFARSEGFFSSTGVDKPPLHFLRSGVDGVNGVYRLSTTTVFPDQPSSDNCYWVDVVFAYNLGQVAPVITSTPVTSASVGQPYTYDVNATGSPVPSYQLVDPPLGMTIDQGTGLIQWTPTATGDYPVTVEASNGVGTPVAQSFTINVVNAVPSISLSPASLSASTAQGSNASSQSFQVRNSGGGTLSYTISSSATWLSCTPASGTSTGEQDTIAVNYATSVLSAGTYTATITITGSGATNSPQTIPVSLEVVPSAPLITSTPVTSASVGQPYTYDVHASGNPAPGYRLLSAPAGLLIDGTSGLIQWTPTAEGPFTVTVESFNTAGTGLQSFTINVTTSNGLTVSASNPRYFEDKNGNLVYLTGAHTWSTLLDIGNSNPPPVFDYSNWLSYVSGSGQNCFKLWALESTWERTTRRTQPKPWTRTGSGTALDGLTKFDLTSWNTVTFFDRLASRVSQANDAGLYVIVELFNGLSVNTADSWQGHPFNPLNNSSSINGDSNDNGEGSESHTESISAVFNLEKDYVHHVIDAINRYPNVIYSISNEDDVSSANTTWQYDMIDEIKSYEAGKSNQHPVLMATQLGTGSLSNIMASDAEAVSPEPREAPYNTAPPINSGSKIVIADTDHYGHVDPNWVWKSFTRGEMPIQMDWWDNTIIPEMRWDTAGDEKLINEYMGYTKTYADKIGLVDMVPRDDLSSTGYALANVGHEYLFYQPAGFGAKEVFSYTSGTSYSGYIENQYAWNATTRGYEDGVSHGGKIMCSNGELSVTSAENVMLFNLFSHWLPISANYYAQADVKVASASTSTVRMYSPIVRGSYGTSNTMNGYHLQVDPVTNMLYIRRINNGASTTIGTDVDLTSYGYTWTNYNTLKIAITGTGATVNIKGYVNGTLRINEDDTAAGRITTAGLVGVAIGKWDQNSYLDNLSMSYLDVIPFTIAVTAKTYDYEWFNPWTGETSSRASEVFSSGTVTPPAGFTGDSVLWLFENNLGSAAPAITSTPVTTAAVGQLYMYDVNATGYPAPIYSLLGTPPSGMTINGSTGVIQWTPSTGGNYPVTVEASNGVGSPVTQNFTIAVALAPLITSTPVTSALVGQPYTYDVNATGSPVPGYQLVNSPSGMTIDQGTGLIQWTPTATGDYPVTVEASNGVGTPVAQSFTINVVNAVPSISLSPASLSASTAQGSNASSQSFQVRNSGGGTLSYTISSSATWLSCTPASGTSTGEQDTIAVNYATSVLSAGTYTATITITGSGATNSPQTIPVSLEVVPSAPLITSTPVTSASVGQPYTYDVNATGSPVPGYQLVDPPLGMTIDQGTGLIQWTPTASGDYPVTVEASNGVGAPAAQSFTINVVNAVPSISLSPASLSASTAQGSNASSQSFQVRNSGGGTLSYTISKNATWLSCTPASGTSTGEQDTIAVNYTTSVLSAGTYTATITITASGATNSPQTIPVSLTVNAVPSISLSPASLSASTAQGSNASSQSFQVRNSGGGTLSYTISKNATWLSCTPASGTSTGEQDTITVNYATSVLSAGTYTATITITASGATNSPQTIPVSLTVNAVPSISLSPASLSASTAQGSNASSQSFQVRNTGGGTLSYTISKNATWLSCTPASGTSTGEQDTITVNYATSVLSAGTYTATITITASGATNSPQTIPVSLTVNAVPGIEYSIWSPGVAVGPESQPENGVQVELGVKFRADVDGYITGIRFYKYPLNTGTHTGNLWTMSGTNLGRVTFSGETASGWQEARFAAPIAITANTTYIISYYTPSGHFARSEGFFSSTGVDKPPLHFLRSGVDGVNGVYRLSTTTIFPDQPSSDNYYWVDVLFK